MTPIPYRGPLRFAAIISAIAIASACAGREARPPLDPEAVAASRAFNVALAARDAGGLTRFFNDTVQVSSESGFAGAPRIGFAEVSRSQLTEAYADLFARLGPAGWTNVMEARQAVINLAERDGHHANFAKAGDYVFELGRPGSSEFQYIFVFVFRRMDGVFRLVQQDATFEWDRHNPKSTPSTSSR